MEHTMLQQIGYTLRRIHTYGRESIEALLTALRLLEAEQDPPPLRALQAALERITVTNPADADRLLGCMQAIDKLTEEVTHDDHHESGEDL